MQNTTSSHAGCSPDAAQANPSTSTRCKRASASSASPAPRPATCSTSAPRRSPATCQTEYTVSLSVRSGKDCRSVQTCRRRQLSPTVAVCGTCSTDPPTSRARREGPMRRAPKRRSALNRWRQILPAPWQQPRGQLPQCGSVSCRFASQQQRHYAYMSVAAGCGTTPPVAWSTTVPGGRFTHRGTLKSARKITRQGSHGGPCGS